MRDDTADAAAAHRDTLQREAEACLAAVQAFRSKPPDIACAADLAAAEQECALRCDALFAAVMGERTQAALDCPAVRASAHTLARSAPKRLKAANERQVFVQFQRGNPVPLRTVYYRRRSMACREVGVKLPAFPARTQACNPRSCPFAGSRVAR